MKYKDNIDYLISSIIYLGSHSFYWARSPANLAAELSMNESKLKDVFEAFPGLFRRSRRVAPNRQHYYALQARYAQREGGDTGDPEEVSYIAPLSVDRLKMLTDFVLQSAEAERTSSRSNIANAFSTGAAVLAAATAVLVALSKTDGNPNAAACTPQHAATISAPKAEAAVNGRPLNHWTGATTKSFIVTALLDSLAAFSAMDQPAAPR